MIKESIQQNEIMLIIYYSYIICLYYIHLHHIFVTYVYSYTHKPIPILYHLVTQRKHYLKVNNSCFFRGGQYTDLHEKCPS